MGAKGLRWTVGWEVIFDWEDKLFLKSSLGIDFLIAGGVGPFIWELTHMFLFAARKCLSQEYCFPEAGPSCRVM